MNERPLPRHRAGGVTPPARGDDPAGGPVTRAEVDVTATRPPTEARPRRAGPGWLLLLAAAVAVGLVCGLMLCGHTDHAASTAIGEFGMTAPTTVDTAAGEHIPRVAPQPVSAAQLAALRQATTWGVVAGAPRDPAPDQVPSGELVSPSATVPVFARPGGPAIAALPAQQLDGDHQPVGSTSVPVIARRPGWAQVLLPSKPNGSTGWISLDDPRVRESVTPWLIRVDRERYTLTLLRAGTAVGQWKVGVGVLAPVAGRVQSVTPTGRTFLVADIQVAHPTYSPIILPLGFHSPIFDSFGDGPGTVALHTWTPSSAVYGQPSSHGCIRVPPDALQVLSTQVPTGSPVLIV